MNLILIRNLKQGVYKGLVLDDLPNLILLGCFIIIGALVLSVIQTIVLE